MAGGMSICYAGHRREDLPVESRLSEQVTVRLVAREAERQRHDELLEREHYLGNATVGSSPFVPVKTV